MQEIQKETGVYLFTVEHLEGYDITEYYGLVTGEAIYGANFVKDFFASIADTFGGRVSGYERAMKAATRDALYAMARHAAAQGATAVTGVVVTVTAMGPRMVMANAVGTAVKYRPASKR